MKIPAFFPGEAGALLVPGVLLLSALCLLPFLPLRRLLSPRDFFRTLRDLPPNAKTTPFASLSTALAGTLGVGNLTGVASALLSGGPGAIFWMWAGAVVSIVVKYAEVALAVKYRRSDRNGHTGGAMYYIRDGLRLKGNRSAVCGGIFAVLCILNSLITGNLMQANAALSVLPAETRPAGGIVLAFLAAFAFLAGRHRIETVTSRLMPPLTLFYTGLCGWILFRNAALLPDIFRDIVTSAFQPRAVCGGTLGFTVRESIRFGVMRGIFSNEAGCGTSPTAHARADTKSPHHQACCGVVEVVFDTLILCTLTAFVLLAAEHRFALLPWKTDADAAAVTLSAFRSLAGDGVRVPLCAAVVLFACGTILAQTFYGIAAVGYLTKKKLPLCLYLLLSFGCTAAGAEIAAPQMWMLADVLLGGMTVINCAVLVLLRNSLGD